MANDSNWGDDDFQVSELVENLPRHGDIGCITKGIFSKYRCFDWVNRHIPVEITTLSLLNVIDFLSTIYTPLTRGNVETWKRDKSRRHVETSSGKSVKVRVFLRRWISVWTCLTRAPVGTSLRQGSKQTRATSQTMDFHGPREIHGRKKRSDSFH